MYDKTNKEIEKERKKGKKIESVIPLNNETILSNFGTMMK